MNEEIIRTRTSTRSFEFSLILSDDIKLDDKDSTFEDLIYNSPCDDCLITSCHGRVELEFERCGHSMQTVVLDAISDFEKSSVTGYVRYVGPCEFVSQTEIAKRMDCSKQAVHQYSTGERGSKFPSPLFHLDQSKPVWAWSTVAAWCDNSNRQNINNATVEDAKAIAIINGFLDLKHHERGWQNLVSVISWQLSGQPVEINFCVNFDLTRDSTELHFDNTRFRQNDSIKLGFGTMG